MRSHIQFITVPTVDTPGTGLLLHFDNKRYFFGQMHEGLQRATLQHGSKALKVRDIFLTGRTDIQTTGGLLGMMLTLADGSRAAAESLKGSRLLKNAARIRRAADEEERLRRKGKPVPQPKSFPEKEVDEPETRQLNIYGAPNIMHTIAAARQFIFRQGMPLHVDEFIENTERTGPRLSWKPTWEDANIKVWTMPISSASEDEIPRASDYANRSDGQSVKHSRKRSHEDFVKGQQEDEQERGAEPAEDQMTAVLGPGEAQQQQQQLQELREKIVHDMFDSQYDREHLVATKLADVKLPAKIFIRDSNVEGGVRVYRGPLPNDVDPTPDVDVLVREPWPSSLVMNLPPATPSTTALSYIVQNHAQRGKFRPDKARKLGVRPGPMFTDLTRGKSVILQDGRVVTPDEVLEPGKSGSGVAILDIPSKDYIASLVSRKEWSQENIMRGVEAFIWILGPGVYTQSDARLLAFINRFDRIQHIISSPDLTSNQLMMTSAASGSVRHHLIDPDRYSLLQHQNTPSPARDNIEPHETSFKKHVKAIPGLILELEPRVQLDETEVYEPINLETVIQDMPSQITSLAEAARSKILADVAPNEDQKLPSPDAEIICLGTGSAMPSLYRNVSGSLLRVPGYGSYLFDAGENTLGQLKRIYSPQELSKIFRELKMIWLSHLHADHHLGTAAIIKEWHQVVHGNKATDERNSPPVMKLTTENVAELLGDGTRLFVAAGPKMVRWLHEYSSVEDFGFQHVVPLEVLPWTNTYDQNETRLVWGLIDVNPQTSPFSSVRKAFRSASGLANFAACFVEHCHGAMGVSITFENGFKFTYSGDCRPSRTLAAIGEGSTVLLHEATFDDERGADAEAKKHSTISEAVGVGMQMGAKRVILTHFSQRYQKIPTLDDLAGTMVRLGTADGRELEESLGDEAQVTPVEDPDINMEIDSAPDSSSYQVRKNNDRNSNNQKDRKTTPVRINSNKDMKIGVAFDYMRVKVKDIASLEHYVPAFRALYDSLDSDGKFPQLGALELENGSEQKTPGDEVGDETTRAKDTKTKKKYKKKNKHK